MRRIELSKLDVDGRGVFVIEIIGEHRLVIVGQCVYKGAPRRIDDLLHDKVDMIRGKGLVQQVLCKFV